MWMLVVRLARVRTWAPYAGLSLAKKKSGASKSSHTTLIGLSYILNHNYIDLYVQ